MIKAKVIVGLLAHLTLAEVPEHNPGLDAQCTEGFHYSRGTADCKQIDCPEGAGRTYTYDCSCGEAWGKPFRTCYDPKRANFAVKCVPADQQCETDAKVPAVAVGTMGGFILLNTGRIAAAGSGPIGWGLVFGTSALVYAWWLWKNGKPRRLDFGRASAATVGRITEGARKAVDKFNQQMKGGMTPAELEDIQVFYERWLNLSESERESTREELQKEGVDMIRLGDAIRYYNNPKNQ